MRLAKRDATGGRLMISDGGSELVPFDPRLLRLIDAWVVGPDRARVQPAIESGAPPPPGCQRLPEHEHGFRKTGCPMQYTVT